MNIKTNHKRKLNFKLGILFFSISLSGIIIFSSGESWESVISLVSLGIISIYLVDFDILHPYTWFIPFFLLYGNAYSVLILLNKVNNIYSVNNILILNWIALSVFLLFVGPEIKVNRIYINNGFSNFSLASYPIYIFSIICIAISSIYIYIKGLTSKYAISLDHSIYTSLSKFYYIYLLCFVFIFSKKITGKEKVPWLFLILNIILIFICFTINGERDWILKIIWVSFFVINTLYKKLSKISILIIGFISILLVPILNNLKNIGVTGEIQNDLGENNIFINILNSEFISSGRNLNIIIDNFNSSDKLFYGKTLLWDFFRGFFGFGITPTEWFNMTYFPNLFNIGGGNGFSFIGEGYMNFGIFGVVLWMYLLSKIIKRLYISSCRTFLHFIIYILSMSVIVYILRADFANLFSALFRQMVLPIFFIWILVQILSHKGNTKKVRRET